MYQVVNGKIIFEQFLLLCCLDWRLDTDGGITWNVQTGAPHTDHIEMSGRFISAIITNGTDDNHQLIWKRRLVFPMLRILPNNTPGSLQDCFDDNIIDSVLVDGQLLKETPVRFSINGYLQAVSKTNTPIEVERTIYPSVDRAACLEKYRLTNTGTKPLSVQIPAVNKDKTTDPAKSVYGSYILNQQAYEAGTIQLSPGDSYDFYIAISGRRATQRLTIEHLLSLDLNVKNLSYLPLQYYRQGYTDEAYALIRHLANPSTQRREYPEVSYGLIEAVVQGLMGVDADARTRTISTIYRGAGSASLTNFPVLNTTLTLTHSGAARSTIRNTGRRSFQWKACFAGNYSQAFSGQHMSKKLKKEVTPQGQVISYLELAVAPGEETTILVK